MGTSKGYGMPTGGPWTPLKRDFTRFTRSGGTPNLTPQSLLQGYLRANGGSDNIARGGGNRRGGGGGGGGGSIGGAARSAGQSLGGFLSSVVTVGLDEALRGIGLNDLVGRSATEVAAGLLEVLVGPASTLDDDAARDAFLDLSEELLRETETYEDVRRVFSTAVDSPGIIRMLSQYFAHYIYRLICRDFYEKLLKQEGRDKVGRTLKSIKECVRSMLSARLVNRDVLSINWRGAEGRRLTQSIFQDTLRIYEAPA
jgi:hypothetical protein